MRLLTLAAVLLVTLSFLAGTSQGSSFEADEKRALDDKEAPAEEEIKKSVEDPVTYRIKEGRITLCWGEKRTGGYYVEIVDMLFREGVLKVFYTLTYPEPGEPVIMVITYPSDEAELPVDAGEISDVVLVQADNCFSDSVQKEEYSPLVLDQENDDFVEMDKGKVSIKGRELKSDIPPLLKAGRVLVPVRAISENLGADVSWDAERYLVTVAKEEDVIHLFIGEAKFYLNGRAEEMDTAAALYRDRTLVPLRFVAEALGETVSYCEATGKVTVAEERGG